jgi:hypothetical protein
MGRRAAAGNCPITAAGDGHKSDGPHSARAASMARMFADRPFGGEGRHVRAYQEVVQRGPWPSAGMRAARETKADERPTWAADGGNSGLMGRPRRPIAMSINDDSHDPRWAKAGGWLDATGCHWMPPWPPWSTRRDLRSPPPRAQPWVARGPPMKRNKFPAIWASVRGGTWGNSGESG